MAIGVPDFERLFAKLNNTKLQTSNPPTWELLKELIRLLVQFAKAVTGTVNANSEAIEGFTSRTFLTTANEAAYFPFSRQLVAGTGITFDDSISNQRVISSITSAGSYYDAPLTDGDVDEAHLIFANGECVIVQVPIS